MSLNTAHTPDGRGIILYNGEQIFLGGFVHEGVVLSFKDNPNPIFGGKKHGQLYLTTHRVIFNSIQGEKGNFRSFSIPFNCLRNVTLEQPIFGANYLTGTVLAQPGGNWEGSAVWKLTFNKGGCIEFGLALIEANDRVNTARPANAPPPYAPPVGSPFAPPPEYYMNSGCTFRSRIQETFTAQPQMGTIYMYEQPPPYPGVVEPAAPMYPNIAASAPQAGWNVEGGAGSGASAPPLYKQAGAIPSKNKVE